MAKSFFYICTLALFSFLVTPSFAEINNYVKKYRYVKPSKQQLSSIQKYNHYIEYFSSFSYFVPRHKVSPYFIKALILAESNANPNAVSSKQAMGLGQIQYGTGKQAAKELSKSHVNFRFVPKSTLTNLKEKDLFDPAVNILLTCYLIAKYNYKFEGKLELVLSAWNAGEYTDSLASMKHAPYQETENLIGKVNGYYLYFLKNKY